MHAIADSPVTRHRISVDDYYRMGEVGILRKDKELDLIVDSARNTLGPRPELPNLPLLKLK